MDLGLSSYKNNFSKFDNVKSNLLYGDLSKVNPLITIAIPTFKRNDLLLEAISSALKQIGEISYEIIILDNDISIENETKTLDLIKSFKSEIIYYYKHDINIGMIGNWNRSFELSRGEFLTILHDDDWLNENYILNAISEIDKKKALFFKSEKVDMRNIISKSNVKKSVLSKEILKILSPEKHDLNLYDFFCGYMTWGTNAVLFHKKSAIEIGGFDEFYFPVQDYHFSIKYSYNFGAKFSKKQVGKHRILQNAAMTLLKSSPYDTYKIRMGIINVINKNKIFLNLLSYVLFEENMKYIEDFWKLETSENSKNLLIPKNVFYKIFSFILKIYLKIRRIYYYS
jgi:glycosyltransferase involved in cell wall biosynthesis